MVTKDTQQVNGEQGRKPLPMLFVTLVSVSQHKRLRMEGALEKGDRFLTLS